MDIRKMNKLFKELPLNQQDAILGIIEEKTNEDMKEVITEIRKLKNDMDSKFSAIDVKFSAIDSKFTTVFWILGVLITVLVGILLKVLS